MLLPPDIFTIYKSELSAMFVGLPVDAVFIVHIVKLLPMFIVPQEDIMLNVQEVAFTVPDVYVRLQVPQTAREPLQVTLPLNTIGQEEPQAPHAITVPV